MDRLTPILQRRVTDARTAVKLSHSSFDGEGVCPGLRPSGRRTCAAGPVARTQWGAMDYSLWSFLRPPDGAAFCIMAQDQYGLYAILENVASEVEFTDEFEQWWHNVVRIRAGES
jgi:hypothetical protein